MEAVLLRDSCQCGFLGARWKTSQPRSGAILCKSPVVLQREHVPHDWAAPASSACLPRHPLGCCREALPPARQLSGHTLYDERPQGRRPGHVVAAAPGDSSARWWEREGGPNVRDVHSIGDFVEELAGAGESLVVVEFYASWCGSCRALLPKLLKIAAEHPDVTFLKVNFDECKAMCKSLNIKVLPFFHFYRGADGRLDAFSASISKLAKLREAIEVHNTERCSLGPAIGVGPDFDWEAAAKANAAAAAAAKAAAAH